MKWLHFKEQGLPQPSPLHRRTLPMNTPLKKGLSSFPSPNFPFPFLSLSLLFVFSFFLSLLFSSLSFSLSISFSLFHCIFFVFENPDDSSSHPSFCSLCQCPHLLLFQLLQLPLKIKIISKTENCL